MRGRVRLFPGSASRPGTLLAVALVAGEGERLVVGLLLSAPGRRRLPAHMRTPEERRGPWRPRRGLAELGEVWTGDRRDGVVVGLKSRLRGGGALVVKVGGGSLSIFSTDAARPGW